MPSLVEKAFGFAHFACQSVWCLRIWDPPHTARQAGGLTGLPTLSILSWSTDLCTNMARTHIDKRSRLVSAAVSLAYQNGFGATSLADIAREAEVPLGNVYYYFKTKDDIGDAIVELRLAQLSRPRQRLNQAR